MLFDMKNKVMLFDMENNVYFDSLFNTLYIEIKHKCYTNFLWTK